MERQEPGAQFACPGGRRTLSLHTCFSPILSNGGSLLIAQSQAPMSPLIYEAFLRCRKFGVSLRPVSTPFSVGNFSVLTHDFIKRCESNCKREGPGAESITRPSQHPVPCHFAPFTIPLAVSTLFPIPRPAYADGAQGSVLGPLIFSVYTYSLHHHMQSHNLKPHGFADDAHVCVSNSDFSHDPNS